VILHESITQKRTPLQMTQHSSNAERTPTFQSLEHLLDQPPEVKLQLLQPHAEIARLLGSEILEEEVESLVGERHSRDRPAGRPYYRWGSIRIDGERVPIDVPRVRDAEAGEERPLESYQAMKKADVPDELVEAILLGLAQNDYERVASQFVEGYGLSQSSVSRRFQERAEEALEEFENRSLENENFLALWIDGKHVAGEQEAPRHGRDRGRLQEGARLHPGQNGERSPDQGDAPRSHRAGLQLRRGHPLRR